MGIAVAVAVAAARVARLTLPAVRADVTSLVAVAVAVARRKCGQSARPQSVPASQYLKLPRKRARPIDPLCQSVLVAMVNVSVLEVSRQSVSQCTYGV